MMVKRQETKDPAATPDYLRQVEKAVNDAISIAKKGKESPDIEDNFDLGKELRTDLEEAVAAVEARSIVELGRQIARDEKFIAELRNLDTIQEQRRKMEILTLAMEKRQPITPIGLSEIRREAAQVFAEGSPLHMSDTGQSAGVVQEKLYRHFIATLNSELEALTSATQGATEQKNAQIDIKNIDAQIDIKNNIKEFDKLTKRFASDAKNAEQKIVEMEATLESFLKDRVEKLKEQGAEKSEITKAEAALEIQKKSALIAKTRQLAGELEQKVTTLREQGASEQELHRARVAAAEAQAKLHALGARTAKEQELEKQFHGHFDAEAQAAADAKAKTTAAEDKIARDAAPGADDLDNLFDDLVR